MPLNLNMFFRGIYDKQPDEIMLKMISEINEKNLVISNVFNLKRREYANATFVGDEEDSKNEVSLSLKLFSFTKVDVSPHIGIEKMFFLLVQNGCVNSAIKLLECCSPSNMPIDYDEIIKNSIKFNAMAVVKYTFRCHFISDTTFLECIKYAYQCGHLEYFNLLRSNYPPESLRQQLQPLLKGIHSESQLEIIEILDMSHFITPQFIFQYLNEINELILIKIFSKNSTLLSDMKEYRDNFYREENRELIYNANLLHVCLSKGKAIISAYLAQNGFTINSDLVESMLLITNDSSLRIFNDLKYTLSTSYVQKLIAELISGDFYMMKESYSRYIKTLSVDNYLEARNKYRKNSKNIIIMIEHMLMLSETPGITDNLLFNLQDSPLLKEFSELAVENNCTKLFSLVVVSNFNLFSDDALLKMLILAFKNNNDKFIEDIILFLIGHDKAEPIIKFIQYILIANANDVISRIIPLCKEKLFSNMAFIEVLLQSDNPAGVGQCLDAGLMLPTNQLIRLASLASLNGDKNSLNKILAHCTNDERVALVNSLLFQPSDSHSLTSDDRSNESVSKEIKVNKYGNGITQDTYAAYQNRQVSLVLHHLRLGSFTLDNEKEISNPHLFGLTALGVYRNQIACISGTPNDHMFGRIRISTLITPIGKNSPYTPYFEKFYKEYYNENSSPYCEIGRFRFSAGTACMEATFFSSIEGKKIPLTQYGSANEYGQYWHHMDPEYLNAVLKHANKLVAELVKLKVDTADQHDIEILAKKVGELHWWLAQASPFNRGSAAISEIICKAIFKYHHVSIKWNTMPDCEALACPNMQKYADNYLSFLSECKVIPNINVESVIHESLLINTNSLYSMSGKK